MTESQKKHGTLFVYATTIQTGSLSSCTQFITCLCTLGSSRGQRAVGSVTHVCPSLACRRPRGSGDGEYGAGIGLGPITRPCLPRSLAPQSLQPSCPPAPPRKPSRHFRCPRCVSAPPSPTAGEEKPAVSACSALGLLWDLGSGVTHI